MKVAMLLSGLAAVASADYVSEIVHLPGSRDTHVVNAEPHTYVTSVPDEWTWADVNSTSFLTASHNQHIPQYCGSCWAWGAQSALADRIKIARGAKGADINLSVQYILNCGSSAGSCHGGTGGGVYNFIKRNGPWPYATCQPYLACSEESDEGFCGDVDTTCSAMNTCRTCSTFDSNGGFCSEIDEFPNATIAEHGHVYGHKHMMAEIYARGPIACGLNAGPIVKYEGGIFSGKHHGKMPDHEISVVGWGQAPGSSEQYWIVRNSWGEYWGELSYLRLGAIGSNPLGLETSGCVWATPDVWTETNKPCYEDGTNCVNHGKYVDPAVSGKPYGQK